MGRQRGGARPDRDHGQDRRRRLGPGRIGPLGALRAHVDSGRLSQSNLHAELGQIVCGARPGRERDDETILFWHRGLSITDIALGEALLRKALAQDVGTHLPYRS